MVPLEMISLHHIYITLQYCEIGGVEIDEQFGDVVSIRSFPYDVTPTTLLGD